MTVVNVNVHFHVPSDTHRETTSTAGLVSLQVGCRSHGGRTVTSVLGVPHKQMSW